MPAGTHASAWVSQFTQRGCKLQRLPIPVHIEEFFEYGGKAVCSNHVFNFKIGKWLTPPLSSSAFVCKRVGLAAAASEIQNTISGGDLLGEGSHC